MNTLHRGQLQITIRLDLLSGPCVIPEWHGKKLSDGSSFFWEIYCTLENHFSKVFYRFRSIVRMRVAVARQVAGQMPQRHCDRYQLESCEKRKAAYWQMRRRRWSGSRIFQSRLQALSKTASRHSIHVLSQE